MLDSIIRFSIQHKLIIGLMTLGLVIWGGYSLLRLPIDAVPDITNNQVQIITRSPALAAPEVERLITFPIEQTMATIPEIGEIRSFSRFGLSVVTIVFQESTDLYWARQQISERLSAARAQIPAGTGEPEMAPVTTGLGEIYQYVIYAKPGFTEKYSPTELRTLQDWVVRRQLLGTPGVADVSSFGGLLKQYEIAIDPDRLRSYGLSISDLFSALARNNQNTGGAYIDKKPNAYFIRSEGLVGNLADIGRIVIRRTQTGVPVLIRDVATVQYGSATRYGALTRNGQGEAVGALVLMLKGENANEVIKRVKNRMEQIRRTLPEGVDIHAFLDRSELVGRAINTVTRNLIEGALIVIFVLILFLGNWRAGLIVASVIPLSMLFAVGLMRAFGVSGNLMSLGAIDFGLIVDGAVIIVEATLHHLQKWKSERAKERKENGFSNGSNTNSLFRSSALSQSEMDEEVFESASRIRTSAAFGEIIILIVYLPILALSGIEGKMFVPMAQVVGFAIAGAFILSLTYVPMMSALVLNKQTATQRNISDRMMDFFLRLYEPVLQGVMRRKTLVLSVAVLLLTGTVWLFFTLGGEFIPTLDEGDFAVETRVVTGSSLSQTIEKTTQAERILLQKFPEVKEVISKIGAGEIPTDPMPIEAADLMVILKPRSEWTSASDREELADKMAKALEVLPGVTFGFQQPIQMRFNELISGAKQDVAVKIFGEDLDELTRLARQLSGLVIGTKGATDLYVEQVEGLPQIVVRLDREALARYGLSVEDVNRTISTAFAGESAGLVYEGERRFDLVVRLAGENRRSINDVQALTIASPDGPPIPLSEVAMVELLPGPNQIQREDAKRRLTIGFNVRGRDVESVVTELQQKIRERIKFPTGYYVTYGGQFENLIDAQKRLQVTVPVALGLILLLLFLTFQSMRQALLIFSAIPLAAIGGVLALWVRGMPFSISAAVGFIALFGVAVLNGIVLLAEFNYQRRNGIADLQQAIFEGTRIRLRPVLMTATVASLGFLPMALSNTAGAEVQKPLATVVIGGLITATLLTLLVLPVLYFLIEKRFGQRDPSLLPKAKTVAAGSWPIIGVLTLGLGMLAPESTAQTTPLSLEQALKQTFQNNPQVRVSALNLAYQQALRGTATAVDKTEILVTAGQYNSRYVDQSLQIGQRLPAPALIRSQKSLADARIAGAEAENQVTRQELAFQVKTAYYSLTYLQTLHRELVRQDSLLNAVVRAAGIRRRTGEGSLLEQTAAEVEARQIRMTLTQNRADQQIQLRRLQTLLGTSQLPQISDSVLVARTIRLPDSVALAQNPELALLRQQIEIARRETEVERSRLKPDYSFNVVNQSLRGIQTINGTDRFYTGVDRFTYGQVGISIPIVAKPLRARVRAAELGQQRTEAELTARQRSLEGAFAEWVQTYRKNRETLTYYEESALPQATLIRQQADRSYRAGEIGYIELFQNLRTASGIQTGYLAALNALNQAIINLEYILGSTEP